ncbi:hypothetical protein VNO78_16190 [Psophocarpus tetragonolobus]|uniref:Protein kinase domain-containing protein n=1 Tax=Psophocarpus tetragonolobus TaxID=3891 RepID=A0AAN9SFV1_PSOTE
METSGRRIIVLGTVLQVLLFCLSYVSITAEDIYHPVDLLSINCGISTNFSSLDGRNWIGDGSTKLKFLSETHNSVAAPARLPSTLEQGLYSHARLSNCQFTYSFPVTPGTPKFLRLFFYSTDYQNFPRSKAHFSVQAGPYTLLLDFNASLNADNDTDQTNILLREYCINLQYAQILNLTFIPTTNHSYAFINAIEIVSMPPYLYYNNTNFRESVGSTVTYPVENNTALETMYRLNAGGPQILPSEDTGMLRVWDDDENYITTQWQQSSEFVDKNKTKLDFELTPNYAAPDKVYRTVRSMGLNDSFNMGFNLTWKFPVDSGFYYLLRLYFCELMSPANKAGDMRFMIFVQDQLATDRADVLLWTKKKGVPVVKQYVVFIPTNTKKTNLLLKIQPHPRSMIHDSQVNAIEVFKLSTTSLAGQNPDPPALPPVNTFQTPNKKKSGSNKTLVAVAGTVSGVVLLSFVVAFFLVRRKKKNVSDHKEGTSRGCGSGSGNSMLPTNLCRHFPITEIKAATNNFDELFVVGVGGFGDVYKGYINIDECSTCVAIKRLKSGSKQGLNEFVNEIQMLSQLRHLHLVSLIGYCYDNNEMILVYDFMDRGTLHEHLYGTNNPSLSWKQRLQICIGAARGLHHLHTGAKHMIIHRDVKSTNILLDEKWVAKVSDFGLSRIGPTSSSITHVSTQVKGSLGYLDPEYYKRQRLTEKSDVYSFGVVLLEVLSGRQPLLRMVEKQQVSLVDWAKHLYQKGSFNEIVDPKLKDQVTSHCLHKFGELALSCLLEDGTQRPSMNDVVRMLEFVLQLHDNVVDGVMVNGWDYEDRDDMFISTFSSVQDSYYSNNSGLNTTSNDSHKSSNDSYKSDSDRLMIPENVF